MLRRFIKWYAENKQANHLKIAEKVIDQFEQTPFKTFPITVNYNLKGGEEVTWQSMWVAHNPEAAREMVIQHIEETKWLTNGHGYFFRETDVQYFKAIVGGEVKL